LFNLVLKYLLGKGRFKQFVFNMLDIKKFIMPDFYQNGAP